MNHFEKMDDCPPHMRWYTAQLGDRALARGASVQGGEVVICADGDPATWLIGLHWISMPPHGSPV